VLIGDLSCPNKVLSSNFLNGGMQLNAAMTSHYNLSRVLRLLWLNPGISRVEIAEQLALNRSTITHIINELLDHGVVVTLAVGDSSPVGGRKKIQLGLNNDFGCVGGLELHAQCLRINLVNLVGELLYESTTEADINVDNLYHYLHEAYKTLKLKSSRLNRRLVGLGCGFAGLINPEAGEIRQSIPLQITTSEKVKAKAKEFIKEPFFIDNDANCCCWGEIISKKEPEPANFMFIMGAWRAVSDLYHVTSIGMGLVINHSVYYGKDYSAGEYRSIEWIKGNTGQFSLTDEQMTMAKNDRGLYLSMVQELARNAALLVNVFNLNRIYLGGFFESNDQEVLSIFDREIQHNWSYPTPATCDVTLSTLGGNSVAYGAAGMVIEKIFGAGAALCFEDQESGINLLLESAA
jgi:predicted NBD/HSP70 family sugar kinase